MFLRNARSSISSLRAVVRFPGLGSTPFRSPGATSMMATPDFSSGQQVKPLSLHVDILVPLRSAGRFK